MVLIFKDIVVLIVEVIWVFKIGIVSAIRQYASVSFDVAHS